MFCVKCEAGFGCSLCWVHPCNTGFVEKFCHCEWMFLTWGVLVIPLIWVMILKAFYGANLQAFSAGEFAAEQLVPLGTVGGN